MGKNVIGRSENYQGTGMSRLNIEGKPILFVYINSKFYAMDGLCSHKQGDLSKGTLKGFIVRCPVHGSEFDVRTGEVIRNVKIPLIGKATNLQAYDVTVKDGSIFIEL